MGFTVDELNQDDRKQYEDRKAMFDRMNAATAENLRAYFGESRDEFYKNHDRHGFAMSRETAVNVCNMMMLNRGFTLAEVLELEEPVTDEQRARREEVREAKRQVGAEWVATLDDPKVKIPEVATEQEIADLKQAYIATRMAEEFTGAYSVIYNELDQFVKNNHLDDMSAYNNPDGAAAIYCGCMLTDFTQEFNKTEIATAATEAVMAKYEANRAENDPPLTPAVFNSLSMVGAVLHQVDDYMNLTESVIDAGEVNQSNVKTFTAKALTLKITDQFVREKQLQKPDAPLHELITPENVPIAIGQATYALNAFPDSVVNQLKVFKSDSELVSDIANGRFMDKCELDVNNGVPDKLHVYGIGIKGHDVDFDGMAPEDISKYTDWYKNFAAGAKEQYGIDLSNPLQMGRVYAVTKHDAETLDPADNTYSSRMVLADLDPETLRYNHPITGFVNNERSMEQVADWHKENMKPIDPDNPADILRIVMLYDLAQKGNLYLEDFSAEQDPAKNKLDPDHAVQVHTAADNTVHFNKDEYNELAPFYVGNQQGAEYEHLSNLLKADGVQPVAKPEINKKPNQYTEAEKKQVSDYREYQEKIRDMKLKEAGYEVTPELKARIDASQDHSNFRKAEERKLQDPKEANNNAFKQYVKEYHSRPAHYDYKNHQLTSPMTIEERATAVKKVKTAINAAHGKDYAFTDQVAAFVMVNEDKWALHENAKNTMMISKAAANNMKRLNVLPANDPLANAAALFLDPESTKEADARNRAFLEKLKTKEGRSELYDHLVDLVANAKKEDLAFSDDVSAVFQYEANRLTAEAILILPEVTEGLKRTDPDLVTPGKERYAELCADLKPFASNLKEKNRFVSLEYYGALPEDLPQPILNQLSGHPAQPGNDAVFETLKNMRPANAEPVPAMDAPVNAFLNADRSEKTTAQVLAEHYSRVIKPDGGIDNTSAMRYFTDAMQMTPGYSKLCQITPKDLSEKIAAKDEATMRLVAECMNETKQQIANLKNFAKEQDEVFLNHEIPEIVVPEQAEKRAESALPAAKERVNTEAEMKFAEMQLKAFEKSRTRGKIYPMEEVLYRFMNPEDTPEAAKENKEFLAKLETPEGRRSFVNHLVNEVSKMNPVKLIAGTDEKALAVYREYGPMIDVAAHLDDLKGFEGFVMTPAAEEKLNNLSLIKEAAENVVTMVHSMGNDIGRKHPEGLSATEVSNLKLKKQFLLQNSPEVNKAASNSDVAKALLEDTFEPCADALVKREKAVLSARTMQAKLDRKDPEFLKSVVNAGMQQAEFRGSSHNLYADPAVIDQAKLDSSMNYLFNRLKEERASLKKEDSIFSHNSDEYKRLDESLKQMTELTDRLMKKPYPGTAEQKKADVDKFYQGFKDLKEKSFAYDEKKSKIEEKDLSSRQKTRLQHTARIEKLCDAVLEELDRGIASRTKPLTAEQDVFKNGKNMPNFRMNAEKKAEAKAEVKAEAKAENKNAEQGNKQAAKAENKNSVKKPDNGPVKK